MNGRFETLIYTDCRPGEGLNGSAGLQFQARSDQAASSAEALMRSVLYEPPEKWMNERRPVQDYPSSFAHVHEGDLFVTAAGVYLGREANGGREGNQLTHGITSRDAADYGAVRPAQLYGAQFWRTSKAAGSVSDPVLPGWSPGPFDPENIAEFVSAQPDGEGTLVALASALAAIGDPAAPKVLFIATDPEPVLRWLTAATLLLPQHRAVRIGFKVFCTDPTKTHLPVLALHPEWSPRVPIDNDRGYAVFDLTTGQHTRVQPRPLLAGWVHDFLRANPWDVVDAVQVAGSCGLDDQPEAAAALARAATMRQVPEIRVAEPIVRWLREGPEPLRLAYAGDISMLFAAEPQRWPLGILSHLDTAGCDGLLADKAGAVRLALLSAEIRQARKGTSTYGSPPRSLPAEFWPADCAAAAEELFIAALNADVAPHVYNTLLCLAKSYDVALTYQRIVDSGHRFIVDWANHPDRPWKTELWPCRTELEDQLVDELMLRIAHDERMAGPIGDRWWKRLLSRRDSLEPILAATVVGSARKHSADPVEFARHELMLSRGNPVAYLTTVEQLWSRGDPSYDEMRLLVELTPIGMPLPEKTFYPALSDLLGAERLRPETVELVRLLVQRGFLQTEPSIDRMLAEDSLVLMACERGPWPVPDLVAKLSPLLPRVLRMRGKLIAEAFVATKAKTPVEVDKMLEFLRLYAPMLDQYIDALARATAEGRWPAVFTSSVFECAEQMFVGELRRKLSQGWLTWMSEKPKTAKQVRKELASFGPVWADRFDIVEERGRRNKWRVDEKGR